jgi:hypothetical protein
MATSHLEFLDESVFDFLFSLRKKPALYFGDKSLTRLNVYLAGYQHGLGRLGKTLKQGDQFHGFHDWVAAKLGFTSSTSGWCNMILSKSTDEKAAFDRFFELLEEYRQEQG